MFLKLETSEEELDSLKLIFSGIPLDQLLLPFRKVSWLYGLNSKLKTGNWTHTTHKPFNTFVLFFWSCHSQKYLDIFDISNY